MKITEVVKKLKKENGNEYIKNNDLLWYLISRLDDMEKRVSRTESMQKIMLWIIPICMAGITVIIGLLTE